MGRLFTAQITGRTTAPQSSLTFYADEVGDDIRAVLPRGTSGYLMFADGGLVSGSAADVVPVKVASVGKQRSVGDDPATLTVMFAITSEPAEDVVIPTLT
jgi:hypothetical protein